MHDPDLRPAAQRLAGVLTAVPDEALDRPTPCPDYSLADLITHVDGFAQVFAASARKDLGELTATPPGPLEGELPADWRDRAKQHLADLADAWQAPDAWEGMTQAGGVDLPGAAAGRVALDELVVHGWDIAHATGQPFDPDEGELAEIEATIRQLRAGQDGAVPGLFGPVIPVPADAPALDRVLGLTGRDPRWRPA